jgi:hypothetical protein
MRILRGSRRSALAGTLGPLAMATTIASLLVAAPSGGAHVSVTQTPAISSTATYPVCSNGTCTVTLDDATTDLPAYEWPWNVPDGVSRLSLVASGAPGANADDDVGARDGGAGGLGSQVSATVLPPSDTSVVYVEVGATPGDTAEAQNQGVTHGGWPDGGSSGSDGDGFNPLTGAPDVSYNWGAAGGGGSTSVQLCSLGSSCNVSTDPLIVAAGGGGGGSYDGDSGSTGAAGGGAGGPGGGGSSNTAGTPVASGSTGAGEAGNGGNAGQSGANGTKAPGQTTSATVGGGGSAVSGGGGGGGGGDLSADGGGGGAGGTTGGGGGGGDGSTPANGNAHSGGNGGSSSATAQSGGGVAGVDPGGSGGAPGQGGTGAKAAPGDNIGAGAGGGGGYYGGGGGGGGDYVGGTTPDYPSAGGGGGAGSSFCSPTYTVAGTCSISTLGVSTPGATITYADPIAVAPTVAVTVAENSPATNVMSQLDAGATAPAGVTLLADEPWWENNNDGSPSVGTLNVASNKYTYEPPAGFIGTATFHYALSDGWNDYAIGIADVTVTPTAAPSQPAQPTATYNEGTAVLVGYGTPLNCADGLVSYTATASPGGETSSACGPGEPGNLGFTGLTPGQAYTFTVTETDSIGTSSPSPASSPVTIPLPPAVAIATPASDMTYTQGESVNEAFSCTDSTLTWGISTCLDQNGAGSGTALDTSTLGTHTLTVTAISKDLLSGAASVKYTVAAPSGGGGSSGGGSGGSSGSGSGGSSGSGAGAPGTGAGSPGSGSGSSSTGGGSVGSAGQTAPALQSKTITKDNQQLRLATAQPAPPLAPTAKLPVSFSTVAIKGSKATRLKFREVAFFLGRGVKHSARIRGKTRVTYVPNLTETRVSDTLQLSLKGLSAGRQGVRAVVTYTETIGTGRHRETKTVTATVTLTITIS